MGSEQQEEKIQGLRWRSAFSFGLYEESMSFSNVVLRRFMQLPPSRT